MRKLPLLAVAAALLITTYTAQAPSAHALSCVSFPVEESVRHADAVLIGMIETIGDTYDGPEGPNLLGATRDARVSVERYMKGSGPETVYVHSQMAVWRGWDEEEIGQEWVLFLAEPRGATFIEKLCSSSFRLEGPDGEARLAEIEAVSGPGLAPEPDPTLTPDEGFGSRGASNTEVLASRSSLAFWGAGLAGTLALTGAAMLGVAFVRRR